MVVMLVMDRSRASGSSLEAYTLVIFLLLTWVFSSEGVFQEPDDIMGDTSSSVPPSSRPVRVNLPELGRVQGIRQSGIDFFGGLPYAAPPVGNLRWAPPEPAAPWAPAMLDASHFGPDCWQAEDPVNNPGVEKSRMSEDCLYLNIYTPAGQHSGMGMDGLPVMVWLHGGAFQQGGARRAEYDGRRLAERGTIVVTLNYRLGALGFMVSSSDGIYGNFGLQDQRAALHWIRENIQYFGGDRDRITLFGESAGAVMTTLHLMMDGVGTLFQRAIIQSNPLGWQARSVIVADFICQAMKRSVDCRDLACLRAERVEEIMRAQSSLMGVPRSVGDFFTWGPTLTEEIKMTVGSRGNPSISHSPLSRKNTMFRDLDNWRWQTTLDTNWAAVNVSQPLKNLDKIPDNIPVIIGANKHEGEMFVHSAFPITMSKTVYWMFVGALFRDSASRILKHYRGYVDQIENEAQELAKRQLEEEENRQYYLENQEELDREYQQLLELNETTEEEVQGSSPGIDALVETWSRGGAVLDTQNASSDPFRVVPGWLLKALPFTFKNETPEAIEEKRRLREERRKVKAKERALKEAAKVVVDYRPVMSRIIDDYLFRCPAWHYAHSLSRNRIYRGKRNNVYVYQFSHSTHIPGYPECWGKSCHTSELPYVFQSMDVIRSNYSTLSSFAQKEAPSAPTYPYTDMLSAYRGAIEAAYRQLSDDKVSESFTVNSTASNHMPSYSKGFQRLVNHFFGDYFKEDADEEIASDMADRWVAFAKYGDPNYEGSKAYWRPWRYVLDERFGGDKERPWDSADFDKIFDPDIEDDLDNLDETEPEGSMWSDDPEERLYRRRALTALGMEVVEEDVFQTMLRRTQRGLQDDSPFNNLFFGSSRNEKDSKEARMNRRVKRQLQEIAQNMGVIGTGLQGEASRGHVGDSWDEDFFPEILELKWPPEGRMVERDCTCDMWDRIRYRY